MTIAARTWLDKIEPYRPGKKSSVSAGSLASNESPIGASPAVARAVLLAVANVHRYPDPLCADLRRELAKQHGVDPDQILIGNGSDELIYLLAWAYLAGGGRVVCADPAYRIDEISTYVVNAQMIKVPLVNWAHDLDKMAEVDADIAYVVNPHNPTGTTRSLTDIKRFVAACKSKLVVVDEAYIDFADDPQQTTAMGLARAGKVAVLRTFSKIYGLAGLRVGYLVADASIIATLQKIRAPFSVGSLSQAGALAAALDVGHRDTVRSHTLRLRAEVEALLRRAGFDPVPSQANFVLVQVPDESAFVARLAAADISVRPGSALGLPGKVRISVPSASGLQLLEKALFGSETPIHTSELHRTP